MLDLAYLRTNREHVETALQNRGLQVDLLKQALGEEARRREALAKEEGGRALLKRGSTNIGALLRVGKIEEAQRSRIDNEEVAAGVSKLERERRDLDASVRDLLSRIPNIPHSSVPVGADSGSNVEIRIWGEPPHFEFTPLPHWDIGERLGILDLDRATRIVGSRFAVYRRTGAALERALATLMLDIHTLESGYQEVLPPFLANSETLFGTGNLPKFAEELFRLEGTNWWLIPTAEVPLTCLYQNEILDGDQLPMKLTAWTPCFRKEAGSHGKDVRGILRQHQFQKVELVKLTRPEESYDELEGLVRDAEKILQRLGLHYRVVSLCTGDLGFSAAKTYDIEVWLPSQRTFREISSCSNCEAFQARRANIRYRAQRGAKPQFVHTLNGSGLAVGRTVLAILENYQLADGSVVVPEALRPYLRGLTRIE